MSKVNNSALSILAGVDLAGSLPIFPEAPGNSLPTSLELGNFRKKHLLFNRIAYPGQIHVYHTECRAGERLRVQMLVPVLPMGGAVAPAFAVVAQSLPYSADVQKLPLDLPAGYSAVVAPPPAELVTPARDMLTRADYYPGPSIDTRTLVGGRCYIVVWSPHNHMGKYVLQTGYSWPWRWTYWAALPLFWWQIRRWFGLSRAAAYWAGAGLLLAGALIATAVNKRKPKATKSTEVVVGNE
ncbi:MAG: hypothetical protein NT075_02610 [Chloroflexi bacterium]|nr:hypothetical protein [Chloroflexota bacterium]